MGVALVVARAFSPLDKELGLLTNHAFTPVIEEGMVRLGSWLPFEKARQQLAFFTGTLVGEATVRRLSEASGAACQAMQTAQVVELQKELPASPAGVSKALMSVDGAFVQLTKGEWREVKTLVLGEVAEAVMEGGEAVVHSKALSYFSRMAGVREFEEAATLEIHRRGIEQAGVVCAVNDGAGWCQSFVDYHREDAIRILDQPHAFEHLASAGRAMFGEESGAFYSWFKSQRDELKQGDVQSVLRELERLVELAHTQGRSEVEALVQAEREYLGQRQTQICYAEFKAAGYPVGSGAVESANKLVVEARLKGTGMRWAEQNVNPLLALRNLVCNDRWEEGWQQSRDWQLRSTKGGKAKASVKLPQLPEHLEDPVLPPPKTSVAVLNFDNETDRKVERPKEGKTFYKPRADHPWRRMTIGNAIPFPFAKN
jgi:hypothetical protein